MTSPSEIIYIGLPGQRPTGFDRPCDFNTLLDPELDAISREIVRLYIFLKLDARGKRREGANAWLMGVAYDLLVPMLHEMMDDAIVGRLEHFNRYQRGHRPTDDNFFQLGLMAIFAHSPRSISRQTRERLGKRLYHAARHKIPPIFLSGFFKQIDSKELEARAIANEIEPGFEDWIVDPFYESETPFFHTYPPELKARFG